MARLKNCETCGEIVSSDAGICPHCGAKQKKSGCAILVILLLIILCMATCGRENSSTQEPAIKPSTVEKEPQKQKMVFKDTVAVSFARTKLQECLDIKTDMRVTKPGKVTKLPPTVRKTLKFDGELYEVKQDFEILNVFNVWLKHEYRAVVEFLPGKGYRTVLLQVNGEKIFPPME